MRNKRWKGFCLTLIDCSKTFDITGHDYQNTESTRGLLSRGRQRSNEIPLCPREEGVFLSSLNKLNGQKSLSVGTCSYILLACLFMLIVKILSWLSFHDLIPFLGLSEGHQPQTCIWTVINVISLNESVSLSFALRHSKKGGGGENRIMHYKSLSKCTEVWAARGDFLNRLRNLIYQGDPTCGTALRHDRLWCLI